MKRLIIPLTISLLLLFIFTSTANATAGPQAYLREYVTCDYDYDGTVLTAASRTGQVLASVPNNDDVLQYIKLTLANYNPNTNIKNPTSYKNVITSYPTTNSTQTVYVNITGNDQATSYILNNTNAAPTINMSITWSNQKGGTDLYDADNLGYTSNNITFNLTIRNPSSTKTLSSVNVTIYFSRNTNGGNDAVRVTQLVSSRDLGGASRGTMDSWDLDSDGQTDTVNWVGTLANSGDQRVIYFKFYANITEAVNQPDANDYTDLDDDGTPDLNDKGTHANYTSSGSTLSGTTIANKFSRASIRQGIDLTLKGNYWHVRGFIQNMANGSLTCGASCYQLTYNVSYWKVYQISPATGAPMSPPNQTGDFLTDPYLTPSDGRIYTTDASRSSDTNWFNTTSSTSSKPFYTISMDWQVVWDTDSNDFYTGYINTTLNLPTLYIIDMTHTKYVSNGYISPDTGGENVTFYDNVTFVGSSNSPAQHVEIYSIIPGKTINNLDHGDFNVYSGMESLRLFYYNDTNTYRLNISSDQDAVTVTVVDPNSGTSGYINISIYDFSAVQLYGSTDTIGTYFDTANDRLDLRYVVASSSEMTTGDDYMFNGTNNMTTDTGTPLTEAQDKDYVNVSGRRLIGWKQLLGEDPNTPSNISARILVRVEDGTGNGIPGIKFIDYVPNWTMNLSQYQGNVSVYFYNGASWAQWTLNNQFKITDNGTRTLPDGSLVHAFEFINASPGPGTWNLTNGQMINVSYYMKVSDSGLYMLPVIISAFDPVTGEDFSTSAMGIIKVIIPEPAVPLQVNEGELELAKRVVVGKPVTWIKNIDVYNPNPRPINSRFQTIVFGDTMDGFVSYYNEQGDKIDVAVNFVDTEEGLMMYWDDVINALETRAYEIRVLTPPVLEIDRDIEVLEKLENKMVKLKMDIYLKNFAEEDYSNIILNLPISYQNIFEVRDAFGNQMAFTGGADTSSITIDSLEPSGLKTVTVVYQESYPTIIITPDRDRYDLNSPVGLEILVINGGDTVEYPFVEVEIYTPQMKVMYTTIEKLDELEPLEKTQTYEKFVIPAYAPGGMYIASARFRENFVTLASATGNFLVVGGPATGIPEALQILIVVIVIIILAYFSIVRMREVRRTTTLNTSEEV